ncbi:MAG: Gldg family protein [Alphaproteobacteria bacterium]|nr:Gldg family protein [Alphaproteobacteria bacterium]
MARFAWAFGLAGAVAWIGALSVAYVVGSWSGPPTTLGVLGTALWVAWVAFDARSLADTMSTRHFRLSSGSVALQAVALLVAIVAYAVVDDRLDRTFDLTGKRAHTLSTQTVSVLQGLDAPVDVLAFFPEGSAEGLAFSRLITLYTQASANVRLEWIDPLAHPVRARTERISGPTVVLKQGDREERLEIDFTETNLTRRLVLVQSDTEHHVCWSTGHGEADPDGDATPDGYGAAVLVLEGLNYRVSRVSVAGEGIPGDCEVFVVARPQHDWMPSEREALAAFVGGGGDALVLLDPIAETPGFDADLDRFGVTVFDDVVFDADRSRTVAGMEGTLAVHDDGVLAHPVTSPLAGAVVLPVARSLDLAVRDGLLAKELLRTSTQAWGETDLTDPDVKPDPGLDRTGQLLLGVVVEVVDPDVLSIARPAEGPVDPGAPDAGRLVPPDWKGVPGGRIVVVGDGDFGSNQALAWGSNQDFFLNLFAWATGEEEQIGDRPDLAEPLDLSEVGSAMLCLVSVVFVPGAAMLLALVTLLRRGLLAKGEA